MVLTELARRVWLPAQSTPMAETLASPLGHDGSHWKLPDGLVRSDVRFVDDLGPGPDAPQDSLRPRPIPDRSCAQVIRLGRSEPPLDWRDKLI